MPTANDDFEAEYESSDMTPAAWVILAAVFFFSVVGAVALIGSTLN